MTSLPNTSYFHVGSSASSYSVRDAIESYRRAQFLAAEISTTPDSADANEVVEEESAIVCVEEDEESDAEGNATPRPGRQSAADQFFNDAWDEFEEDNQTTPRPDRYKTSYIQYMPRPPRSPRPKITRQPYASHASHIHIPDSSKPDERTELIPARKNSRRPSAPAFHPQWKGPSYGSTTAAHKNDSDKPFKHNAGGKSTYGQTLFNAIAILVGIGMLSEPIAFVHAGWIVGTVLIVFYGFITCYTAKILARIIISDNRLRSYSDIGRLAFGPKSSGFISLFFCFELFSVSVVLVTLYADSLHTLIPQYSINLYKVLGLIVLIPTVFLPLSLLSYASILGIFSTVILVFVIFFDGLTKFEAPGSIWSPAQTSLGVPNLKNLGLSFGLFMAGFSGHAVMPSLARDMANPEDFDHMINWAFTAATFIYMIIGYAGYVMFGVHVSDEISMDLLKTPGFNPALNKLTLWLLVISPLTKYALSTQPMNVTVENMLGLTASRMNSEDQLIRQGFQASGRRRSHAIIKRSLAVIQRILLTVLAVAVSIAVPEFSALMSFLGSFSAFALASIGPIVAKMLIMKKITITDIVIVVISSVMAVWGTLASVLAASSAN